MQGSVEVDGYIGAVEVGRGGFATVYRASREEDGADVALKVFDAGDTEGRRINREASALTVLSGIPGVVPIITTTFSRDGRAVLVMPYLPDSLARYASGGGVEPEHGVRWLEQLSGALDRATLAGVHHRDIKPANVLLDADGNAFLTDFGIAALTELDPGTTTALAFSPPYAAPERLDGTERDPRPGDIYALAATTWAVIVGGAPFGTATTGGVNGLIRRIMANELDRPESMPVSVFEVLRRGMALDPARRFGTAGEMAAAARAALDGTDDRTIARAVTPLPPPIPGSSSGLGDLEASGEETDDDGSGPDGSDGVDPAARRRRRLVMAGIAAALLLFAGGIAAAVLGTGDERVDASAADVDSAKDRSDRTTTTAGEASTTLPDTQDSTVTVVDPAAAPPELVDPAGTGVPAAEGVAPGGGPVAATGGGSAATPAPAPAPAPAAASAPAAAAAAPAPTTPRATAPPVTTPPVPTNCTISGGRATLTPGILAFTQDPQSAFLQSPVSCQLSNGATLGGKIRATADFPGLGFNGGSGTGTGIILWDDARSTNLNLRADVQPIAFDVYRLTLGFTFTSGFGAAGSGTTGAIDVAAEFDPSVNRVVAISGISGSFAWRR